MRAVKGVVCGTFVEANADENLRAAVQQSARMEALGSLTAGIAHDFNNLLTVLVGNLYLLAEDLRGNPKLFERLKAARDAGKRGADLIKQLLTFARREQLDNGHRRAQQSDQRADTTASARPRLAYHAGN